MRLNPLSEGATGKRIWPDFDPEPAALLLVDFIGSKMAGRPIYKRLYDRYADATQIPGWNYAGSTSNGLPRYAETKAGKLVPFAAGMPRITDRGLLDEEARTNVVQNNTMVGVVAGSPGTLPTGWSYSGAAPSTFGLAQTLAAGTENGLPYLEVTLAGTPTTSGGTGFYFTGVNANVPASAGQTWTASIYARLVGVPMGVSTATVGIVERDSGGASPASATTPMALTTTMARYSLARTLTGGATVAMQGNVGIAFTSGAPLSVTYRIYGPQLELGGSATSLILTSGAAATRTADSAYITALGAILGQFRTNYVWNSTMAGATVGSPGTLPTGWNAGNRGLTVAVVGLGLDGSGFPSIDVRFSGVVATAGNLDLRMGSSTSTSAAVVGSQWTAASTVALIDGSPPAGQQNFSVWEADASANWLASTGVALPTTATSTRVSAVRTFSNASVVRAVTALQLGGLTVGQAVDVTYRISAPQLEPGIVAPSAFIATSTGPVTVGSPFTLVAWADLPANDGTSRSLAWVDDGQNTTANRSGLLRAVDNSAQVYAGAVSYVALGKAGARVLKLAARYRPGSFKGSFDGVLSPETAGVVGVPSTRLNIAATSSGTSHLNGYIQRIAIYGDVDDATLLAQTA